MTKTENADALMFPELEQQLSTLSVARLRTAGDEIVRDLMPTLDDEAMWQLVIWLTRYNNRAFLGTLLKALVARLHHPLDNHGGRTSVLHEHQHSGLVPHAPYMRQWAEGMTAIDRHKTLLALLPLADTPQELSMMLEIFGQRGAAIGHGHDIDYLIQCDTVPAYFVLLGYMRLNEHNRPLLLAICRRVMRGGSGLAFNAVALFKVFFDLNELQSVFSLRVQPYELGRLEHDFALFCSKLGNR